MKQFAATLSPEIRAPIAGILGWLLPGAGHLFIGERTRGIIIMAVIAVTFWSGVAIGGVKNTVNCSDRKLWFAGQICAGGHALVAMAWSKRIPDPQKLLVAYGRAEDVSVVYTAICGMLNVLVIFDVLVRAEHLTVAVPERGPPARTGRRAT